MLNARMRFQPKSQLRTERSDHETSVFQQIDFRLEGIVDVHLVVVVYVVVVDAAVVVVDAVQLC